MAPAAARPRPQLAIVASGMAWSAACVLVGALWTLAAWWRIRGGSAMGALRGVLAGAAAAGAAAGAFATLDLAGLGIQWEEVSRGGWRGLSAALAIGAVEESAKLAGIVLATSSRSPRDVFRATAAVATAFAAVEAALALRGATWVVALGRAGLAPVAHGALAIPIALALARATSRTPTARALRIAGALAVAALLHGGGDWCVGRPGVGRLGFAAALLAPVAWGYLRRGAVSSTPAAGRVVASSARSSSATPHACAMQPRGV